METFSRRLGRLSGAFEHAEGWRRHSHMGFCAENDDPLKVALGSRFSSMTLTSVHWNAATRRNGT